MPLNAQAQGILDQFADFKAPPLETLSPGNARNLPTLKNAVEEMSAQGVVKRLAAVAKPMPEPVGGISHVVIPSPGGDVLARVYTPKGAGPFPVLVYFHGGGWVIANLDVYEPSCRALCNAAECVVVSAAYRQAPEHKFPAAVDDAHAAVQWALSNAATVNGDPSRVAVGGESAGGNLATVSCLIAKERSAPMPVFQLLIYPVTDLASEPPSYAENRDAKPLNAAMMPWFKKHYLADLSEALDPHASPARSRNLGGLPPALIITAGSDPLRDDGEMYAEKLRKAGVPVQYTCYDDLMHEFFGLSGVLPRAKEALDEAAQALKSAFERTPAAAGSPGRR
jgi:acetyl esterase